MHPSTHRSLLASALLWPLLITMVVLAGLFVTGYYQQQQLIRDNIARDVQVIAQRSDALANQLDRALQGAETSVNAYREELVAQWQKTDPALQQALAHRLRQQISLARDGAYRSVVSEFDAQRHAGIWLPKYIVWQAHYWPLLAVSAQVTQSYGRASVGKSFVDTWFMPAFGGIVIYWPEQAEFIYRAAADFDYRPTEWVTLTQPENNPSHGTQWTSLSFDEVSQMWMVSVVAPLYLNGQWSGSVGHDMPLSTLLSEVINNRFNIRDHFLLLSADGNVVASDQYEDLIVRNRGHLKLSEIAVPQFQTALSDLKQHGRSGRAQDEEAVTFAHTLAGGKFVLLQQVSLQVTTQVIQQTVTRGKWLMVLALVAQVLITIVLSYRAYRRAYKDFNDLDAVQERLRIALTDAAYNTREISAISYGISHDLRAPLRHLTGFTQMLREQSLTRMNADDLQLMHKIEASAARATRLTEKLLTYMRISQQELRCKEINLQALIERVIVESLAEWRNSKVEWKLNAQMMLYADPNMLRELFYQLFDNALAALSEQEHPQISVSADKHNPYIVIVVHDNGRGFEPERAEHLFEMFQRLQAAQENGPGVGLAIARRIVERHGGKVSAKSTLGEGSEFIIQLPLAARPL